MPTVSVYNQDGVETGTLELDAAVFGVAPKASVLHQVVVAQFANAREAIASTKTRGEVRGGGRKPWKQKGTGRARAGSIRSPIWVGGGTTFGPRASRVFAVKVNAKVRRAATRMALSDKVAHERFVVLEDFAPAAGKTKAARVILEAVTKRVARGKRAPSVLLVLPTERKAAATSVRNLERTTSVDAAHLNVADLLRNDVVVTTRSAVARATELLARRVTKEQAA